MAKAKAVPPQVDHMVQQYILLRERITEIKEEHKKELEKYETLKERLAGRMIEFLDDTGQEAARTTAGTVYITNRSTASLADPEAFMDYVRENDAYELMDRRANSVACREFAEEHNSLPPGVKLNNIRTVGVRST